MLFVGVSLVAAGVVAFVALGRGGLPNEAGRPPVSAQGRSTWPVYARRPASRSRFSCCSCSATSSRTALLTMFGLVRLLWLILEAIKSEKVERERLFVVLILMFFSMLFWAFFEQAGSSVNNFTDRNVDRVIETRTAGQEDVGQIDRDARADCRRAIPSLPTLPLLTQEQLGRSNGEANAPFTLTELDGLRAKATAERRETRMSRLAGRCRRCRHGHWRRRSPSVAVPGRQPDLHHHSWPGLHDTVVVPGVRGARAQHAREVLARAAAARARLWCALVRRAVGERPRHGLRRLAAARLPAADDRRAMPLACRPFDGHQALPGANREHRDGRLVPGNRLLELLAGRIAQFTGVEAEGDAAQVVPPPIETVHLYGDVFGQIAIIAIISALICLALSPLLKKWMHTEAEQN